MRDRRLLWSVVTAIVVSIVLTVLGGIPDPTAHHVTLHHRVHVALTNARGWPPGSLVLFDAEDAEPWFGSILGLEPRGVEIIQRDFWGIYIRQLRFGWAGKTEFTFAMSLWYPIIAVWLVPAVLAGRRIFRRAIRTS